MLSKNYSFRQNFTLKDRARSAFELLFRVGITSMRHRVWLYRVLL